MRILTFCAPLVASAALASIAHAAPSTEADVQANYCLAALEMQDDMVRAARWPRDIDTVLGSTAKRRSVQRARLAAFLAGHGLSPSDAENARSQGASRLAPDLTELIFATPSPTCRYITRGTCVAEAWARSGALARQAPCLGDLAWLDAIAAHQDAGPSHLHLPVVGRPAGGRL